MIADKVGVKDFTNYIERKRLVAFGASVFLQVVASNYAELELGKRIEYVVDNDTDKYGSEYYLCGQQKNIFDLEYLLNDKLEEIVVLISSEAYAYEIYKQLSAVPELDKVHSCCLPVMIAFQNDDDKQGILNDIDNKIPKIIHCFWFSGLPKDAMAEKCIQSWKRYCPDFEIKEWTHENYDYKKNSYMYNAYKAEKWAYATDYARLDAVYEYGGFYFDLDLELLNSIDDLCSADFIAGFGPIRDIELAAFGASKHSYIVGEMLSAYENKVFDPQNLSLKEVQPIFMDRFLEKKGFEINGEFQNINNQILLHRNAFSPRNWFTGELLDTERSYGIHHCAGSWIKEDNKKKNRNREMKQLMQIFG